MDITRMNRKQRRELRQRIHLTIPGRNLPYEKAKHGSLAQYYDLREKEIQADQKAK